MIDKPLSVLVVDDTITYRKLIADVVNKLDFAEATTAPTGEVALMKLAQSPFPLVLLDVEMPGIGGLETLKRIRSQFPGVEVVMVSGATNQAASVTIKAMNVGAFEFVRKPTGGSPAENAALLRQDLEKVIQAVWRKKQGSATAPAPAPARAAAAPTRFGVLAIGVSTGGPNALTQVVPALPGDFPLPIVLVQHMPAPFTKALASDLDRKSALNIREAAEGDPVRPGQLLIAPGSRHMVTRSTQDGVVIGLNDGPKENSCRPAVDVLFRSVAACYGTQGVLALIMTGMGADGLKGVQALKRKSCYCMTQSASTCVVYGMPQAVDAAGLSDESVDLQDIARRLTRLAAKRGEKT